MKPLLVGECPGRTGGQPLEGAIGYRLAELAGLTYEEYLERTERTNLFDAHQPTWDAPAARLQAWSLVAMATAWDPWPGRYIMLLGRRVAVAFGFEDARWMEPRGLSTIWVALPHPSGRNRWYNDPENRDKLSAFLRVSLGRAT